MYRRKIEKVLQSWLSDTSHKPLVVKGVRLCGKTSSVMDFATKNFKHVVYLDFLIMSHRISEIHDRLHLAITKTWRSCFCSRFALSVWYRFPN